MDGAPSKDSCDYAKRRQHIKALVRQIFPVLPQKVSFDMFSEKACELNRDLEGKAACLSIFRTPGGEVEDLDERADCLQLSEAVSDVLEDLNKEAADQQENKVSCCLLTLV